jgi:predicted transcriptional regulator
VNLIQKILKKRIPFSQLKRYDVNQKVLEALADAQSRTILFSIIKQGKTAQDLSERYRIPLSSVYKKISDLDNIALIKIEKWVLSESGKKFKVYRSRISRAEISIKKPEPVITLTPNE